jgi:catechol-2,3-dioxygenase
MSATAEPLRRTLLSHVGFRTPDPAAMARFYGETMGLVAEDRGGDGLLLGWGTGHHAVELVEGEAGFDHFGLEVADPGGQAALGERLAAAGTPVEARGDGLGSLRVRDPDGNAVDLHGPISRTGELTADTGRRPVRVQHVTMGTAAMEPMVEFYVRLGFRITDRMGNVFTWLRSNVEHHSVAIVLTGKAEFDHYSFDLSGWADFKVWADRLTDLDVPVQWGPGRHGPGNNLFLFFDDPDGNHVELSAEMEKFFDDRARYETRVWDEVPKTINLWGGQLPNWRRVTDEDAP